MKHFIVYILIIYVTITIFIFFRASPLYEKIISKKPSISPNIKIIYPGIPCIWNTTVNSSDFQRILYQIQQNVTNSSKFLINVYHHNHGIGSHLHVKSSKIMLALMYNRTFINAPKNDWLFGYDKCTNPYSFDGCIMYNTSIYMGKYNKDDCKGGMDSNCKYVDAPENPRGEVVYSNHIDYKSLSRFYPSLAPFTHMPPCWWIAQMIVYLTKPLPSTMNRMFSHIRASLKLPKNDLFYLDYAKVTSENVFDFWKHFLNTIYHEWQTSNFEENDKLPRLGYIFIRSGDKHSEAKLQPVEYYVKMVEEIYNDLGIRHFYVASDNVENINTFNKLLSNTPFVIYTNSLTHNLTGYYVDDFYKTKDINKNERMVWRTLLDLYVSQLASVHGGTFSSNQCRLSYEMSIIFSGKMLPFYSLEETFKYSNGGSLVNYL